MIAIKQRFQITDFTKQILQHLSKVGPAGNFLPAGSVKEQQ
jgi:hypothetical protein